MFIKHLVCTRHHIKQPFLFPGTKEKPSQFTEEGLPRMWHFLDFLKLQKQRPESEPKFMQLWGELFPYTIPSVR